MVTPPVSVQRRFYRGSDPKKRAKAAEYNADAAMLENHINAQITAGQRGVFLYSDIAREVGLPVKRVAEILFSVDCGHNGFTVTDKDSPS